MFDYELLRLIWWMLIGVLIIAFAITDGFDMGVATLVPIIGNTEAQRRVMINTVAPHWDGNQVWLVTAGGAIFAAWPQVYATAFSGFYIAMILTLAVLWLRPLAFDFRSKMEDSLWKNTWDWALCISGFVPPIIFGVAFGNLLQGVPFRFDELMMIHYEGSFWELLNPFALLCGVMSLAMFTAHGAIWLQMKTRRELHRKSGMVAILCALLVLVLFVIAGFWIQSMNGYSISSVLDMDAVSDPTKKTVAVAAGSWMHNFEQYHFMWIAPCLAVAGALLTMVSAWLERGGMAFFCSVLMIAGIILTAGFSMFPFIMPSDLLPAHSLTLWDATSSYNTLSVMAIVACIFVPIVLLYTIWCYSRMFGRIDEQFIEDNTHSLY